MKNNVIRLALLPLPLALVVACGSPPPPTAPAPAPVNLQAEEQKIRALDQEWNAALAAKNIDAAVAFYAPDAEYLAPNADPATTPEAIRRAWTSTLSLPEVAISFTPTSIRFAADASMAYEIGSYQFGFAAEHGRVDDRGKYLVVWRKAGGEWKVVAESFNTSVPMTPPPTPPGAPEVTPPPAPLPPG